MTTDPKKNEELKDLDLEGVAGGQSQRPDETHDDIPPTGDYGEPMKKSDVNRTG